MTVPHAWISTADAALDDVDAVGYDADTARAVLPVSAVLAAFYVAFALLHHLVLGQDVGHRMDLVAVTSTALAIVVGLLAWLHGVPDRWGHPLMAALIVLTTVDAAAHLAISRDPTETASFMLVAMGAGVVLLRLPWFAAALAVLWAVWLGVAATVRGDVQTWASWGTFLALATIMSCIVVALRRRSIDVARAALTRAVDAATTDSATGLANRRGLALRTAQMLDLGVRRGEIVHCTFLDVDGLKAINDAYGHDAGDDVIVAVAEAVESSCRASDVVARWGGDEFVVVGLGRSEPVDELQRRVRAWLDQHHPDDQVLSRLHISVGRSELAPWEGGDPQQLLWRADHDMYLRRGQQAVSSRTVFLPDGAVPFEV